MRRTPVPWLALLLAVALPPALPAERYDLDLVFDPVSSALQGTAVITFDAGEVTGGAFLLLYDNLLSQRNPSTNPLLEDMQYARGFTPGFTTITDVSDAEGRAVPFAAAESALLPRLVTYPIKDFLLRLDLPEVEPGQGGRLSVRFVTRLPAQLSGDQTSLGGSFVQRFLWFPLLSSPTSPFTVHSFEYTARITVPSGYQLISSGREEQQGNAPSAPEANAPSAPEANAPSAPEANAPSAPEANAPSAPGGNAWTLDSAGVARAGIPVVIVRTGTLAESRLEAGGRGLRVFARPAHQAQARKVLSFSSAAIAHYEQTLGPLPDGPVTLVEGVTDGLWGMAGDGLVLLGRGAFTADLVLPELLDPLLDFLVSHEIAHLWFGVGAGTDFSSENWLSESLAQYASVAWIEEKRGALENYFRLPEGIGGEALRLLLPWNSQRDSMAESILSLRKSGRDFPLLAPPERQNLNGYAAVLYDRGAMAMRQLRLEAGEEPFDNALRAYCESFRGRTGGTGAFLEVLEGESPGITPVARRILDTMAYPDYSVDRVGATPEGSVVSFTDRGASGLASTAVIVTDRETVPVRLEGDTSVAVEGTVRSVQIDPRWATLDTDRRNNSWPRRLNFPLPTGSPFDADTLAPTLGLQVAAASDGSTLLGLSAGMRYSTLGLASFSAEAGWLPVIAIGPTGFDARSDAYASLGLALPRSLGLDAYVAGSGGTWRAAVGLNHTVWLPAATGTPSPLFTPSLNWSVSAGIDQDATITPAASLDIEGLYARLPFLFHLGAAGALGFPDAAPFQWAAMQTAVRLETEASLFLRLLPRFYAVPVIDAALGFPAPGSGIVPGRLRAGDATAGDGRGYIGLDLLFPIANGLQARLANLAILRSVFGGLYAEAQDVFTGSPTLFVLSPALWDLHAGIQVGVTFTTLGGAAFPLAAGVDIAVSQLAWGTLSVGEALRVFLSVHVPTGFYGLNLTW